MRPIEMQLQHEAEVLAERQERIDRYTRFFASPHAQAIASMGKQQMKRKPKVVEIRKTA